MKQQQIGTGDGLSRLTLVDAERRPPQPGEVAVQIHACSLNFSDFTFCSGMLPVEPGRVPLVDASGVVTATGDGVEGFKIGDHVISTFFADWPDGPLTSANALKMHGSGVDGFASEEVTQPSTSFTLAPKGWSHAEASTLSCAGVTAWRALVVEGGLKSGQTVLVQGSGGVSVLALQIAKSLGARVIAISSKDDRLERLKELGADTVINYRSTPDWGVKAAELGGVDLVVDVGGESTLPESLNAVRVGGKIIVVGVLGGMMAPLSIYHMLIKQISLQAISVGSRQMQQDLVKHLDKWDWRPVLDRHFPLENLPEAFEYMQSQQHFGKIVVTITDE